MQAGLNASALLQRARMLVPAIVQGLTRRPAARDLHVQGAPVFAKANAGGTALNTAQQSSARGVERQSTLAHRLQLALAAQL
jgi:hypothetical protein